MVSSKALFTFCAISGITRAYPIHQDTEDASLDLLHSLVVRSPSPRFRNPFDVNQFLDNLDYKIPDNKDIQQWIDEAQKKGAMAAEGDFDDDDDDGQDDDHDHDHDHDDSDSDSDSDESDDDDDDDDKHHDTTANPKASDNDDGKDGSKKHNEVKQAAQPAEIENPSTSTTSTLNADNSAPTQTTTVYVPYPVLPTRFPDLPDIDANEGPTTTELPLFPPPTSTASTPATTISSPATTSSLDITSEPQVTDTPVAEQPVSDAIAPTTSSSETIQPIPRPSPFAQLSHLLDLVSDDDQSDPSY